MSILHEQLHAALSCHGLSVENIRMCLLFGSQAKGYANANSDLDVIFVVSNSDKPFEYKRLSYHGKRIDSNYLTLAELEQRIADFDWDYRVFRSTALREFSSETPEAMARWLERTDQLITSPQAFLRRAWRHLEHLNTLIKLRTRCGSRLCSVRTYLDTEIVELIAFVILDLRGIVPFSERRPPTEVALSAAFSTFDQCRADFKEFHNHLLEALPKNTRFSGAAESLASFRRFGRRLTESLHHEAVGAGYFALLDWSQRDCLAAETVFLRSSFPQIALDPFLQNTPLRLSVSLRAWYDSLSKKERRRPPQEATPCSQSSPLEAQGPRVVMYSSTDGRLKGILSTGGCRVATCTFCMLPKLSRPKSPVSPLLDRMESAIAGPVLQTTIYTDGSFFDNRELEPYERRVIADRVTRWGSPELLVESLPRFISLKNLSQMVDALQPSAVLRIAVGLQSTTASVRKSITQTPIEDGEFTRLLSLRARIPFTLRVYLLVGKHLLTWPEDVKDVIRSLHALNRVLCPDDTVTINPLLPTRGTIVSLLLESGFFDPINPRAASELFAFLQNREWTFQLEFGPILSGTCTASRRSLNYSNNYPYVRDVRVPVSLEDVQPELDASALPWGVLGSASYRAQWIDLQFRQIVSREEKEHANRQPIRFTHSLR